MDRSTLGFCGGLLVALATLFVLAMVEVALAQTGASLGKTLFFSTWAV